jgi:multidrug transporter EmrE-like cation transporter
MTNVSKEHSESHVYILITLVIFISILEICGQTCIRKFRDNGQRHFIILGIALYLAVVLLLFHSYRYHGMGIVNLLWSCLSIIMAIVVGHFIFNEDFNHYMAIAIVLAFGAIVFANMSQMVKK